MEIFLDIDGYLVTGSQWDPWFDQSSLGGASLTEAQMTRIEHRLERDWGIFGIDFTFEDTGSADATLVFTPDWTARLSPGQGAAYYDTFGSDTPGLIHAWDDQHMRGLEWWDDDVYARLLAETASHELGHMIGLEHDADGHLTCMKTELRRDAVIWSERAIRLAARFGLVAKDDLTGTPYVIV